MFRGYHIVSVTQASRERYLKVLVPQVLSSPLVDEYCVFVHEASPHLLDFLDSLGRLDGRVHVISTEHMGRRHRSDARHIYPFCLDPRTVYVRFDENIVFIEQGFFPKFLRFRIMHPEYFAVFPNTINNPLCTYLHVMRGTLDPGGVIQPWYMDKHAWANPRFAEQLHKYFIVSVAHGCISRWHFGPRILALNRNPTYCFSWFGRDFATFRGILTGDEEEYISITRPSEKLRANCIYGDAIVSYFASPPQKSCLESTDLLEEYARLGNRDVCEPEGRRALPHGGKLWASRLTETIDRILLAKESDLLSAAFVADQIRHAGLIYDPRRIYGADNMYMNTERAGLWQVPMQLARFLVYVQRYHITRLLDVGTGAGWTAAFMAAYLLRFNVKFELLTIDIRNSFDYYSIVKTRVPVKVLVGKTVADVQNERFDCVFIDANHGYRLCRSDYEMVGASCPLCAFHDIQDQFVASAPANEGGVPKLWTELKGITHLPDKAIEFLDHPSNEKIMGIGLLARGWAKERMHAE